MIAVCGPLLGKLTFSISAGCTTFKALRIVCYQLLKRGGCSLEGNKLQLHSAGEETQGLLLSGLSSTGSHATKVIIYMLSGELTKFIDLHIILCK